MYVFALQLPQLGYWFSALVVEVLYPIWKGLLDVCPQPCACRYASTLTDMVVGEGRGVAVTVAVTEPVALNEPVVVGDAVKDGVTEYVAE